MLALSRKSGESVVLTVAGHTVTVSVGWISSRSVQLGIEAPLEVRILRGELVDSEPPNDGAVQ